MNGSKHEIDAIPAGNSAGTLSTCCSLLFSLYPSFSLDLRRSSPAALIVFLIRTRWDGIMYTFNYSDTSTTRDTPPPQTCHSDFIIVSVSFVILISLFLCDAPLNLFACKFIRPFLSRILSRRSFLPPAEMETLYGIIEITHLITDLIFSQIINFVHRIKIITLTND